MGLDVALLSADVSQDYCRAVAYSMQASRQAVQGSQELVVSIAAGTVEARQQVACLGTICVGLSADGCFILAAQ